MQRLQDECALRVADQHHAAALVVVLQVVLPRISDVVVLKAACRTSDSGSAFFARATCRPRSVICRYIGANGRQCDAKRANCCRTTFFSAGSWLQVAVRGRIGRHRRVDIEAVDRRLRVSGKRFLRQRAVGGDDRRRQVDVARVALAARAAQPGCRRLRSHWA